MKRTLDIIPQKSDTNERNLFICKQIDQPSIESLVRDIIKINEEDSYNENLCKFHNLTFKREPIKIYIDSYGGMVYQTLGLIAIMDKSETPIHTIVTGCAMSAGFMILISGHKRFAYEMATPLYHQVSAGAIGTLKGMEVEYFETQRLQKMLESIVLKKTKITRKKLDEVYQLQTDWYMSAKEAKKLGVVDIII